MMGPGPTSALGVEILVKRDDPSHAVYGGNRLRQLKWLLADASLNLLPETHPDPRAVAFAQRVNGVMTEGVGDGLALERSQTILTVGSHCDFRWVTPPAK